MMGALPGFGMSGASVHLLPFRCSSECEKTGGGRRGWVTSQMVLNRDVDGNRAANHAELRCAATDVSARTHTHTRGRFP